MTYQTYRERQTGRQKDIPDISERQRDRQRHTDELTGGKPADLSHVGGRGGQSVLGALGFGPKGQR